MLYPYNIGPTQDDLLKIEIEKELSNGKNPKGGTGWLMEKKKRNKKKKR